MSKKLVFTTGEAAKLCKVSTQKIIKCCNSGMLKYYHVPGSSHRRITRAELIKFMKENGLPLGELAEDAIPVVILADEVSYAAFAAGLDPQRYDVAPRTESTFALAMAVFDAGSAAYILSARAMLPDIKLLLLRLREKCPADSLILVVDDLGGVVSELSGIDAIDHLLPATGAPELVKELIGRRFAVSADC